MSSRLPAATFILSLVGLGSTLGCNGVQAGVPTEPEVPPVQPQECSIRLAEALVDQKGGTLKVPGSSPLYGARLQIPAGAVSKAVRVVLYAGEDLMAQGSVLSPTLCVRIEDRSEESLPVTLAKPAALILPYEAARVSHLTKDRINHLAIGERKPGSETAVPMPGLTVVDERNRLLAAELRHTGRYLAITRGSGALAETPNLDVMFVLDSSGSMTPKQKVIAKHFMSEPGRDGFFKVVTRYDDPTFKDCINYHIGVTTTDVGMNAMGKGDDGLLQTTYCNKKPKLGSPKAKEACNTYCDPMAKELPMGHSFIARGKWATPAEQEKQFACMAIVGDEGSGEESPLESIARTLDRQRKTPDMVEGENFFREKGITAMVILTDEDDCSIKASRRAEFYDPPKGSCNPMDLGQPECWSTPNARCRGVSLKCDQPLNTSGMKTGCMSRTGMDAVLKPAKEYAQDVRKFIIESGDGNLGRMGKFGTLYLYGAWPIAQAAMDFEKTISFELDINNPPPSNMLGTKAFCYDPGTLMSDEPVYGSPSVRLNEFALEINSLPTGPMDLPQVTAASICREGERNHLLDKLANAITDAPMVCAKPLIP